MRRSPASSLTDLPFLIAGLTLGFQALLRRLRVEAGLRHKVAIGMGSIFFALLDKEECIMKDLATRLRMPKSTLSGLVARMEAVGWIARAECPEDGRALRLRLTRKARAMEPSLHARHKRAIEILQAGLNAREIAQLKRLLGRVVENLREQASLAAHGSKSSRRSRALASL
jgi:DNA-binding MarR family transcriptional regulator